MTQHNSNGTGIAECEARLLERRAELVAELRGQQNSCLPPLRVRDADQACVLHDRFVAEQINTLTYSRLRQVEAALARLAHGDYGICESCGETISPQRLAAIPWAERCIGCEEAHATRFERREHLRPAA